MKKTYRLHDNKVTVTITVPDGPAAGEYETTVWELKRDTVDGVWDTRRTIVIDGREKNLKLKVDDCTEIEKWAADWDKIRAAEPETCWECEKVIAKGHETFVTRFWFGNKMRVALCECCKDGSNE